jgi:hypothetical protein
MIAPEQAERLKLPPDTSTEQAGQRCQEMLRSQRHQLNLLAPSHPDRPGLETSTRELEKILATLFDETATRLTALEEKIGKLRPENPIVLKLKHDRARLAPVVEQFKEWVYGPVVSELCYQAESALEENPPKKSRARQLLEQARDAGKTLGAESGPMRLTRKLEEKLEAEPARPVETAPASTPPPTPLPVAAMPMVAPEAVSPPTVAQVPISRPAKESSGVRPPPAAVAPSSPRGPRSLAAVVATAVVLLAGALCGWWYWGGQRAQSPARPAGLESAAKEADAKTKQPGVEGERSRQEPVMERAAQAAPARPDAVRYPQAGERWTNSLGQVFAPVAGTGVLFCIWDTRVRDYAAYAAAKRGVNNSWRNVENHGVRVSDGPEHPVTMVDWEDAKGYCRWLTEKERSEGRIGAEQSYRLPTDAEWSVAVGLGEESGSTPEEKDGKITGVYPWGREWPPPRGAGNYADLTLKNRVRNWQFGVIDGYDDGYAATSPVGSFTASRYGLYDMGGNVWQLCEDWYDRAQQFRVLRGGSWVNSGSGSLLSSRRVRVTADSRFPDHGFRCVLAKGSTQSK